MKLSSRPAATLVLCVAISSFSPFPGGAVHGLAQDASPSPIVPPVPSPPAADAPHGQAGAAKRPRLALVLSGGGARGAAHIGVIKVLEELHVPPDLITGTSIGSIVGGLYATGWSPQEMEDLLAQMDWNTLFVDRLERDQRSFRRKQDDLKFHIPVKMRFKDWKPYLPAGVLGGQHLELFLRALQIESTGETDFDRFPIPYRAVAADIVTSEAVVIDHGSLADAMRASMSIPGAFPPAVIEGRKLVDGGAVANLPIGVAQDLGAEAVIAVDITSPLYEEQEITSFLSVMNQQSGFLTVGNRLEDLRKIRPGDVVVRPELGDLSFRDFARAREAVAIGEAAARAHVDELRKYAVSDEEWAAFMARHHRRPAGELRVDDIRIDNTSWVDTRVIEPYIHQKEGEKLDLDRLNDDIMHLSGLDYFGVMRDDFTLDGGRGDLSITTPPKPYGRNSLQFGVALSDDFEGDADYSLAVRHLLLAANRMGGEWENILQIGNPMYASSAFYQPLDYGMRWFAEPQVEWRQTTQSLWIDGDAVADFRFKYLVARLDFGRVLGNWGEVRLGVFHGWTSGHMRVGPPIVPPFDESDGGARFRFRVDTLDSTVFPRHGTAIEASYRQALDSLGNDVPFRQAYLRATKAWTFGHETLVPGLEIGDNLDPEVPLRFAYTLGGFLRLSGLAQNELIGSRVGLARVVYYHELTTLNLGVLTSRLFVGASAEIGNTFLEGQPVSLDTMRHAGSLFVGGETPVGPVVLALGDSDGGVRRVYLIIGQIF